MEQHFLETQEISTTREPGGPAAPVTPGGSKCGALRAGAKANLSRAAALTGLGMLLRTADAGLTLQKMRGGEKWRTAFLRILNAHREPGRPRFRSFVQAAGALDEALLLRILAVELMCAAFHSPEDAWRAFYAIQRGRFFELCRERLPEPRPAESTLFLSGLLSAFEPLVIKHSHNAIDLEKSKRTLAHLLGAGAPDVQGLVNIVAAVETQDWSHLDDLLDEHPLSPDDIIRLYGRASIWCAQAMGRLD